MLFCFVYYVVLVLSLSCCHANVAPADFISLHVSFDERVVLKWFGQRRPTYTRNVIKPKRDQQKIKATNMSEYVLMSEVRSALNQQHPSSASTWTCRRAVTTHMLGTYMDARDYGRSVSRCVWSRQGMGTKLQNCRKIAEPWQVPSSKLYFGIELPDCEAGFWDQHWREREHTLLMILNWDCVELGLSKPWGVLSHLDHHVNAKSECRSYQPKHQQDQKSTVQT